MASRTVPSVIDARPKRPRLAICPTSRDVLSGIAARAHRDAEISDKDAALRHNVSRRTANRWRNEGRGSPAESFALYLLNCSDPWRMVSHAKALAKRVDIEKESRAELIRRTRELLSYEKEVEGMDSARDLSRNVSWADRAALKERDAAIDEELAARFRRLAELKVPESEVFG